MKKKIRPVILIIYSIAFLSLLCISLTPLKAQDICDCNNHFTGSDRKAVKLRSPNPVGNQVLNQGNPITIRQWFSEMHFRDPYVPEIVSQNTPIPRLETTIVTVDAFLLACKYEHTGNSPDQDIHCEIAESPNWNSPHVVVEVPAGRNYCQARKAICNAWTQDETTNGDRHSEIQRIFKTPIKIRVAGFVFLDYHHATRENKLHHEFAISNGNRGIRGSDGKSKVMGLWEIHPVITIK